MKTKETQIWNELKEGSISALESLYNLYVDKLFAYGCKITKDKELVQDEIHDLFLNLYKYHEKLANVINIESYLIVSLKRNLYKHNDFRLKSMEDELKHFLDTTDNTNLIIKSHEEAIIEDENENTQLLKLRNIMTNLTNHQKRILHLRFNQEKSYKEISRELGLSIASARTLFYRTLKTIRKAALNLFL